MDILNPPQEYIDYRCALHGKEGESKLTAHRKFYDSHPGAEEICHRFSDWKYEAMTNMSLPFERIEVLESDGKKHGRVVEMMIVDIEYWIENGNLRKRKHYIMGQGEFCKDWKQPDWLVRNIQQSRDFRKNKIDDTPF